MNILTTADYRSMPWKNGLGTTIEIAVFPESATLQNFIWRVSRAQVVADGSFSLFEGIDRTLALLDGTGMRLIIDGSAKQVDVNTNAVSFAGDANVVGVLIQGAISDLNIMTRRTYASHQLQQWMGAHQRPLPPDCVLLYCAQGCGYVLKNNRPHQLTADQSMQFFASDDVAEYCLHSAADSVFYCVQIQLNG